MRKSITKHNNTSLRFYYWWSTQSSMKLRWQFRDSASLSLYRTSIANCDTVRCIYTQRIRRLKTSLSGNFTSSFKLIQIPSLSINLDTDLNLIDKNSHSWNSGMSFNDNFLTKNQFIFVLYWYQYTNDCECKSWSAKYKFIMMFLMDEYFVGDLNLSDWIIYDWISRI